MLVVVAVVVDVVVTCCTVVIGEEDRELIKKMMEGYAFMKKKTNVLEKSLFRKVEVDECVHQTLMIDFLFDLIRVSCRR